MKLKIPTPSILLAPFLVFGLSLISKAQAGSLDLTFGDGGIVTTPMLLNNSTFNAVAMQTDNKIVAVGAYYDMYPVAHVMRYNEDGTLDETFDDDGIVTTTYGLGEQDANAVAIQPDGKILISGHVHTDFGIDFAAFRFNTDGSPDNSFDGDGVVVTNVGPLGSESYSMALQEDGKILLAGISITSEQNNFGVVRYNTDGSLDNTFDFDGIVNAPIFGVGISLGGYLAVQPDGKIVVTGNSWYGFDYQFITLRLNVDGSRDETFGDEGIVITSLGSHDGGSKSIAIQSDNKIIISGTAQVDLYMDYALIRYNEDGSLDNSFSDDGILVSPVSPSVDQGYSMCLQDDGKILVAGEAFTGEITDIAIARYHTNGDIDSTFDFDGKVFTHVEGAQSRAEDVVIQADGKIVIAGISSGYGFTLARYNNPNLLSTPEIEIDTDLLSIYPNPTSGETNFQMSEPLIEATATLYNSIGEKVAEVNNISGYTFTLSRNNLPSGLYYISVMQNNQTIAREKLIFSN